ncbi:MAG: hypothetical protein QXG73_02555 [Candidatus Micrarchaeaceae archaeon]
MEEEKTASAPSAKRHSFEEEFFEDLQKEKPSSKYLVTRNQPLGILGRRVDIAVYDLEGTLKEIYEIKATDSPTSIRDAQLRLGSVMAALGKDVEAYVVVPSKKDKFKLIKHKKDKFKLLKQDTVYVNSLYRQDRKDRFNLVCWVLALITFTVLLISIMNFIKLDAIEFSLYLVGIGLILAPFVSEMSIGDFLKWKRTNPKA